jgi:AraC family transcriptional regulator
MTGILAALNGVFGRVTYFDISEPVGSHAHPHVHLLFKVSGDDRLMVVEGLDVRLESNTCILINPWQEHCDARPDGDGVTRMLALYIEPAWLAEKLGGRWQRSFETTTAPVSKRAKMLVEAIREEIGQEHSAHAYVESMLLELIRDVSAPVRVPTERRRSADYRIKNAVQLLKEAPQLHNDFRSIARDVGLSRSRFFEQFRSSVGVAPNMFVDSLVIEEAIRMLAGSGQPLGQISVNLGFAAPSSFTRFFKERVGFTPSQLRRRVEQSFL